MIAVIGLLLFLFQSTLPGWGATDNAADGVPQVDISIHAPRMGSDTRRAAEKTLEYAFQSTLPGWGATPASRTTAVVFHVFQSTLPGWGATYAADIRGMPHYISIHAPRMGSDCRSPTGPWRWRGISIHAPRMGSDRLAQHHRRGLVISIHAPRMGSDLLEALEPLHNAIISIHAPRMGSDMVNRIGLTVMAQFQSTLPGWGATSVATLPDSFPIYFNPRSPDGERLLHS